ncbi:hypothetical protein [Lewinella sp. W8]|uniref:hypothetical protein n=1 Tax=Lewinella sp. W8 TaxID=2528208 RepID=UPI001067B98F|nr:hypothetical protein [Lewinella sp. W8]MTB53488.1 hypothetical protein [Lewinella sp. W8]
MKKLRKKELESILNNSKVDTQWTDRINFDERFTKYTIYRSTAGEFIEVNQITGKGAIVAEEHLIASNDFRRKISHNLKRGIQSSHDQWKFYHSIEDDFSLLVKNAVPSLSSITRIPSKKLTFSLASFKEIDETLDPDLFWDDARLKEIYDPLMGYIGEYMRLKSSGTWIKKEAIPCILTPGNQLLMPHNIIFSITATPGVGSLHRETKRATYSLRYEKPR